MSCGCGGACSIPQNTLLSLRWDDYTRCSALARPADRKLCKLAGVLRQHHHLQDEETPMPKPDADDLAERLRPHAKDPARARSANGIYGALRELGYSHAAAAGSAVHAISHAPKAAAKLSDESAAQAEAPDLASAISEVAAHVDGRIRDEVAQSFRAKYDELRGKMAAARARKEAALYAQSEAERLAGLLGPHRDDTVVDPYLKASRWLAEDVATRQKAGTPFDVALAESKRSHPELVAAIAKGPGEDD